MSRGFYNQAVWLCVGGILVSLLSGCGPATKRKPLEGTVTLDGEPLSEGTVRFLPRSGTGGPAAGGKITDGRFEIDRDRGAFAGTFRVEITATRKTGKKVDSPFGHKIDGYEQYLSDRYGSDSELTAQVTESGPNEFAFALESR